MATITFRDGTHLTAEQNGTCFITDSKPDFPDDLSIVRIEGEYTSVLHNAVLIECASVDGRYWFSFIEKTAEEIEREKLHSTIGDSYAADRRYAPGDYLTVDGTMYKVLLPIMPGAFLTPGTNIEETSIQAEIAKMNKEES